MNKFETNQCPLCGQILQLRKVIGVTVFSCPTTTDDQPTHYEVETDNKECIQHIYVGQWGIDNFATSSKSRIYKKPEDPTKRWKLVKEVALIRADTQENMLNRIEKLMLFL